MTTNERNLYMFAWLVVLACVGTICYTCYHVSDHITYQYRLKVDDLSQRVIKLEWKKP